MSKRNIVISGILVLFIVYLLCCMFAPSAYGFKDEIKINGPYKMAFVVTNDMKDWPKWFSWKKSDPDLSFSIGGKEQSIGSNFSFKSSLLGNGYVEQTQGYPDSIVTVNIISSKLPSPLKLSWQIIPDGKRSLYVNLNARLSGKIPFLKRGWYFGLQNKLNKLFHEDLIGIKTYIEDLVKGDFGVEKVTYEGQKYFGKLDVIQTSKIPEYYAKYYPIIYHMLDSMNVKVTGAPAGLIYDWDAKSGLCAIMAALPVDVKLPFIAGMSFSDIQKAECLRLKNFGNYNTLRNAHTKMNYLMDDSPYRLGLPMIEEYVTSPSQEPDTSKWQTNIYYLLDSRGGYIKSVEQKQTLEDIIKRQEAERAEDLKNLLQEIK